MKQFLEELLEYNHHFNQKLADIFNNHSNNVSQRVVGLYSHLLNAHQICNSRIEAKQPDFGVWDIHPIQEFKQIDKMNNEHSLLILEKFDLNEMINYTNTKGQPYSISVQDLLFHTINHSTYHRAQIATECRQCGIEPLITDWIYYKNFMKGKA